jgi:hypothetical protein
LGSGVRVVGDGVGVSTVGKLSAKAAAFVPGHEGESDSEGVTAGADVDETEALSGTGRRWSTFHFLFCSVFPDCFPSCRPEKEWTPGWIHQGIKGRRTDVQGCFFGVYCRSSCFLLMRHQSETCFLVWFFIFYLRCQMSVVALVAITLQISSVVGLVPLAEYTVPKQTAADILTSKTGFGMRNRREALLEDPSDALTDYLKGVMQCGNVTALSIVIQRSNQVSSS